MAGEVTLAGPTAAETQWLLLPLFAHGTLLESQEIPIPISKHVTSIQSFRLAAAVDKSTNQRAVTEWFEF